MVQNQIKGVLEMSNLVITIAREYGSGGRYIGNLVAKRLNIKCYDNELISIIAESSGLSPEFVEQNSTQAAPSFLYSLYMDSGVPSVYDQLYIAQSNAIKNSAKNESCVIIGRCADYVLRHHDNLLRVFIHAPMSSKVKRVTETYKVDTANPEQFIRKKNKKRSSYYEYTTQNKWGYSPNYDLCINSDMGAENIADMIAQYVKNSELLK